MKKYFIIILCLLFIAGITSCATKQDEKIVPPSHLLVDPFNSERIA